MPNHKQEVPKTPFDGMPIYTGYKSAGYIFGTESAKDVIGWLVVDHPRYKTRIIMKTGDASLYDGVIIEFDDPSIVG